MHFLFPASNPLPPRSARCSRWASRCASCAAGALRSRPPLTSTPSDTPRTTPRLPPTQPSPEAQPQFRRALRPFMTPSASVYGAICIRLWRHLRPFTDEPPSPPWLTRAPPGTSSPPTSTTWSAATARCDHPPPSPRPISAVAQPFSAVILSELLSGCTAYCTAPLEIA